MYVGEVRYARDAFEGLRLMDAVMAVKRGETGAELPEPRARRVAAGRAAPMSPRRRLPARSDVAADNPVPTPPFWGERVIKGIPLADYAALLDERATFLGQWGLKPGRGGGGPSYEELVETEGRPRLRMWLERMQTEGLLEAGVVYGYFPAVQGRRPHRPARRRGRAGAVHVPASAPRPASVPGRLLPARRGPARPTWSAFQLVTVGPRISEVTAELFAAERLPRLPGAARAIRPADRGAGRVLAQPDPRGAGFGRGRPADLEAS